MLRYCLALARTGMVLGNAGTATGAYIYANALLDRKTAMRRWLICGGADALGRDPEDNRRGKLRQLVSRDHTDIRVSLLYAFSAFISALARRWRPGRDDAEASPAVTPGGAV